MTCSLKIIKKISLFEPGDNFCGENRSAVNRPRRQVDCNVTKSVCNPIRIYEFYEHSLWPQVIASEIKTSFMGHITDSKG